MTNKNTTIQVSVKTRDRLARFGLKDETFDSIILRLLTYRGKKQKRRQG